MFLSQIDVSLSVSLPHSLKINKNKRALTASEQTLMPVIHVMGEGMKPHFSERLLPG